MYFQLVKCPCSHRVLCRNNGRIWVTPSCSVMTFDTNPSLIPLQISLKPNSRSSVSVLPHGSSPSCSSEDSRANWPLPPMPTLPKHILAFWMILLNPSDSMCCIVASHDCSRLYILTAVCTASKSPDEKLSLIHISEPTRLGMISYAVFCLKKK